MQPTSERFGKCGCLILAVTPNSALADPQQIIADLRRELAASNVERDEALAQQAATAEILQVINSSPGDLTPVFDGMLEKAMALCEADYGHIYTFEGHRFHTAAIQGEPGFVEWRRQRGPIRPAGDGTSALERLVQHDERVVQIADALQEQAYRTNSRFRELIDASGSRSMAAIALHKEGTLLGAIIVYRREMRPFSDKQISLLQNFAAQAVIAMENARLITETREALGQQTATAEVLGVINSSPGDLGPVFDAMLEKALRLCEAAFGVFITPNEDGRSFKVTAMRGVPPKLAEFWREPVFPHPGTGIARIVGGEEIIHVLDSAAEQVYAAGAPERRAMVDLGGVRTMLTAALRKNGVLLGLFTLWRQEVRPFSDKQIALLQNFAAQAVIAIENARLLTETREALEQQTATAEVLGVINASPGDLAPVFDAILEKAHSLCGAEVGALFTYDGETFWAVAAHGGSTRFAEMMREGFRPASTNPFAGILKGEQLVHIADVLAAQVPDDAGLRFAAEEGVRTFLVMPLRKDDVLLGVITALRHEVRPFTDKQIALLQNFAAQAVIAMENARLITETREALEQQTATAEVLQVINSSPGDLAPVFDAMLEKAMRLCEANFGFLSTYDGSQFSAVAVRGLPEPYIREYLSAPYLPGPNTTHDRLVRGELVVHVPNLAVDEADSPRRRAVVDVLGVRSILAVPLRKDGVLVGAIHVYRQEVRPFSEKQIALLQNFAAQAVIAMENARLLGELRQRTEEVAELNRGLEARVAEQVEELGRVGRLKRFLAPQLAELIVSQGDEKILESHRREIVVVFCDLRGYTAFTETAEPEEVLDFLREYHGALGPLVSQFEGTLDQFSGDGIMVFFNDPVPIPDPATRAVNMAAAMREASGMLIAAWRERGRDLGFGVGIAQGYATLGQIGFSERSGYTAIGTVCNVAARLCAEAKDGQILLSQRVNVALKGSVATEQVGALALKGLTQPVVAYNVPLAATQPAFRVIEGGSPDN